MDKINFALVGCGRIGERHAKHAAAIGNLVAVCDSNEDKSKTLGEFYNASHYSAIEDLLKSETSLDVVAICTPNGLHAAQSILALKSGVHVLCEKPMAIAVKDCEDMINQAERASRRLFIVKQNRFNPAVVEVKKLLENGVLGDVYSIQLNCFWNRNPDYYTKSDWKGKKELDGGTLFTQFSHFIDLLYWMVGDVEKVSAFLKNYNHKEFIEFEDSGVVNLSFRNGTIGAINYTVNSYSKNMEGSLTFFCEKGTVKIGGQYLNKLEYQDIEGYTIGKLGEGNPANEYGEYQGSMSNHDLVYQNVVEVLQNQGVIATNGLEGLKTVEIIEKIYRSANG